MREEKERKIISRISEIEDIRFMIDMSDVWTDEERKTYKELGEELKKLREELKQYES